MLEGRRIGINYKQPPKIRISGGTVAYEHRLSPELRRGPACARVRAAGQSTANEALQRRAVRPTWLHPKTQSVREIALVIWCGFGECNTSQYPATLFSIIHRCDASVRRQ